jgi:tryptophan 2,3-dioxygenase
MEITPEIVSKINLLEEKYRAMGQDLNAYLEGLLMSNYLTYWDYVKVDTLLSLQSPKTDYPDELIFILYHQITELYFKLSLHEIEQISSNGRRILPNGQDHGWNDKLEKDFFIARIHRINRYFEVLTHSFAIMVDGMEKEQFLKYRMALLPASGFQSAQYRKIEICCTDLYYLVDKEYRNNFQASDSRIEEMFENIYWKKGATDLESGKKTLTLKQFEKKYTDQFVALSKEYESKNIWKKYLELSNEDRESKEVKSALRLLDVNVNVNWPLVHYKSAVRYLASGNQDVAATGGTNWQKYLPPRFQKRIFYPQLWTEEEMENWGKSWVDNALQS